MLEKGVDYGPINGSKYVFPAKAWHSPGCPLPGYSYWAIVYFLALLSFSFYKVPGPQRLQA